MALNDSANINDRLNEIEDDIIKTYEHLISNIPDEILTSNIEIENKEAETEKWLESLIFTFNISIYYKHWVCFVFANKIYFSFKKLKKLFILYFKLSGAPRECVSFLEEDFFYDVNVKEAKKSFLFNETKFPKITMVDGFIMEGKSLYCKAQNFYNDNNIFLESDFLYRCIFTEGKNKDHCMLHKLNLMAPLHLITSKINSNYNFKKNSLLDRSPLCCCIFDGVSKRHCLLDFISWTLGLRCFDIKTNTFSFVLKLCINQRPILPDSEKRIFESKAYFPDGNLDRRLMTQHNVSYYLTFIILLDNLVKPQSGTVLNCGYFNNSNTFILNKMFPYFDFMCPHLHRQLLFHNNRTLCQTKLNFIKKIISENLTYYLENEHEKVCVPLDFEYIEKIIYNFNDSYYFKCEDDSSMLFLDVFKRSISSRFSYYESSSSSSSQSLNNKNFKSSLSDLI